jgi:hypothetical protein
MIFVHQEWIRIEHVPAYIGLFIGGLLPAVNGMVMTLTSYVPIVDDDNVHL